MVYALTFFLALMPVLLATIVGAAPKWNGGGAKTHHVTVGGPDKFFYSPHYVHANPGDTVVFRFREKNHTVTQSSFDNPCKSSHGFDSGFRPFIPGQAHPATFHVKVHDKNPVWAYCQQGDHCAVRGMVFAINPQKEGKTFKKFQAKATGKNWKRDEIEAPEEDLQE